jgi:hypothetical protein
VKFLLIDFGASFVKASIYDNHLDFLSLLKQYESPFLKNDKINIYDLKKFVSNILNDFESFDAVVSCSIKNGCFIEEHYISWKLLSQKSFYRKESVIGSLFVNEEKYHIHHDHDEKSKINDLRELGFYNNKLFLSCLGDTECVKRAFNLDDESVIINLGTGSQIIYSDKIYSFFPSGRMFLVFEDFFSSLGCNFFDELGKISINEIIDSSLEIDINIFPQSRKFTNFGAISNIKEYNFTKTNLLSSLLKNYIEQYIREIDKNKIKTIYLSGGICKKLPVIKKYIEYRLNVNVIEQSSCFPETHHGMVEMIKCFIKK